MFALFFLLPNNKCSPQYSYANEVGLQLTSHLLGWDTSIDDSRPLLSRMNDNVDSPENVAVELIRKRLVAPGGC